MRSFYYVAVCALAVLAAAQTGPNAFLIPAAGYSFSAGTPTTLQWQPSTSGTVTLKLQWGSVTTASSGITIASSIPNSGSFTWTPSGNLPPRPDYTIEIVDDSNPSEYNFLPRFQVAGATGVATSSAAPSSSGTPLSSSAMGSSSMMTMTASSSGSTMTATSTGASSTGASSSGASTSASSATPTGSQTSFPKINGGVANQVSGGMMIAVLGAFALM